MPTGLSEANLFSGAYALPVRGTEADADGAFYLSNVPAGRYILAAAGPVGLRTYFPNSADRSAATPITLKPAETANVGSFTLLAPGTEGARVPPDRPAWDGLRKVPVRINVEDLSRFPFPFELFFASLNNQAITVRFEPRVGKLPPPSLEFNRRSLYISMPVPENFSGVFEVPVWDGEFSVLPTGHPVKNGFYIKGLSIGNTDLMRQRLKVPDSVKDTLVVTLAHCTDTTPECNESRSDRTRPLSVSDETTQRKDTRRIAEL